MTNYKFRYIKKGSRKWTTLSNISLKYLSNGKNLQKAKQIARGLVKGDNILKVRVYKPDSIHYSTGIIFDTQ